jgi:hypothetical protein
MLRRIGLLAIVTVFLVHPAFAWLIGDNGPEPVFVQVKQALRLSLDFDSDLRDLATTESQLGLTVEKLFIGSAYLERVGFPAGWTDDQILNALTQLQQLPAVEQVVAASASNLVFRSGDIGTEYSPDALIPEAVRRGIDSGPVIPVNVGALYSPHVVDHLIVGWKSEYVWNDAATGFLKTIANFNAASGCHVITEFNFSPTELAQVLQCGVGRHPLAWEMNRYINSGYVHYVETDAIFQLDSVPYPTPVTRKPAISHAPVQPANSRRVLEY